MPAMSPTSVSPRIRLSSRIVCSIEYILRLAVARRAVIPTIPSLEAQVELRGWCLVLNSHADDDLPSWAMRAKSPPPFDPEALLTSTDVPKTVMAYAKGAPIYSQGSPCDSVLFVRSGEVKLSVISKLGKEAIVAVLEEGSFFGEGALAGQPVRLGHATAHTASTIVAIAKANMRRLLHEEHEWSDGFIAHLLTRNIRTEEDLIEQLFNSAEHRLARTLLRLAHYGGESVPQRVIPKISQEMLAEMVGTTRSRVNYFMNRFKKLGFIGVDGRLTINNSLLSVVLHD
jgi:CRP/FNR family transcriptional regulator, cyclic AMP receptor protein